MKIRNGFVSNSSSASFVLTIKSRTDEEFFKDALKAMRYSTLSFDRNLKDELEKRIKKIEKTIAENENKNSDLFGFKMFAERDKDRLKFLQSLLAYITDEKIDDVDKAKKVLEEYHGLQITYHAEFDDCAVKGFTTMYNDDNDIPEVLRTMTAFYTLNNSPIRMEINEGDMF